MKRLFAAALVAGGMLAATVSPVSAATLETFSCSTGTCVSHINELTVNGFVYNLAFVQADSPPPIPSSLRSADPAEAIVSATSTLLESSSIIGVGSSSTGWNPNYFLSVFDDMIGPLSFPAMLGYRGFTVDADWQFEVTFVHYGIDAVGQFAAVTEVGPAPVPIPAAFPLLMSALGFFGFMGWRRRLAAA